MTKKIINKSVSEYTVFVRNRPYRVQPQGYLICEDDVAKEFMKYYPTVLKVEDVAETPKPPEAKVEEPIKISVETPKVEIEEPKKEEPKVAKKEVKKISAELPKRGRGRPKKSK